MQATIIGGAILLVVALTGGVAHSQRYDGNGPVFALPARCPAPGMARGGRLIGGSVASCPAGTAAAQANEAGAATGSISGAVTEDGTGTPLAAACVIVSGEGTFSDIVRSAADGTYSVGALPPDNYRVYFLDCAAGTSHRPEWYNNRPDAAAADAVSVGAGAAVTGIDAALAVGGGSISGIVTDGFSGAPLSRACVSALNGDEDVVSVAASDDSGAYTVNGLDAGTYYLNFSECDAPAVHVAEWYSHQPDIRTARGVEVTGGHRVEGVDEALAIGASISGTARHQADGTPLTSVCVDAFDGDSFFRGGAITDANGSYTIGGLPNRDIKLRFTDCSPPLHDVTIWFGGADSFDAAATVRPGGQGTTQSGFNASLAVGGSIAGDLRDRNDLQLLPGLCVDAYDLRGNFKGSAMTLSAGNFELGGLAVGAYKILYQDCRTHPQYIRQWFSASGSFATADEASIFTGETLNGVVGRLVRAGVINGTVRDADTPEPLRDICAAVYDTASSDSLALDVTTRNGHYEMPVAAGAHKVVFYDCSSTPTRNPAWYSDRQTFDRADPVLVHGPGTKTGNVNAVLALHLSGDVDCSRTVTSIDAALILQAAAGLIQELGCQYNADLDGDHNITPIDAALILQYVAGLLVSLPP